MCVVVVDTKGEGAKAFYEQYGFALRRDTPMTLYLYRGYEEGYEEGYEASLSIFSPGHLSDLPSQAHRHLAC